MSEEKEEGPIMTEELDKPLEERVARPTSLDVTENQFSISEVPVAEPQEEKPQEMEQAQEKPRISRRKQKRRITSYLSSISKQVEKQGSQINKLTIMIQPLLKQEQTKSTTDRGVGKIQSQSIKQIQSQISQLQKQVARTQNEIRRIRTAPIVGAKTKPKSKSKKLSASTFRPRSKKGKSLKATKVKKKGRKAGSYKRKRRSPKGYLSFERGWSKDENK